MWTITSALSALLLILVLQFSFCNPAAAAGYTAQTGTGVFTTCACSDSSLVLFVSCNVVQSNITLTSSLGGIGPQRYTYECLNKTTDTWSTIVGLPCTLTGGGACPITAPTLSACEVFDVSPGGNVKQIEIWTNSSGIIQGIVYTDNYGYASTPCGLTTGASTIVTAPTSIPNAPLGYINWYYDNTGALTGMQSFWTNH